MVNGNREDDSDNDNVPLASAYPKKQAQKRTYTTKQNNGGAAPTPQKKRKQHHLQRLPLQRKASKS